MKQTAASLSLFALCAATGLTSMNSHAEVLEPPTHSSALYEGKYATGGQAAIHREETLPENRPIFGVSALWESKYVSEGRDNLEEGGIFSFEGVMEWKGFSGGAWFAQADSEAYQELNLFAEYSLALGPVDLSVGYCRLEFLEDSTHDNEYAAGAALNIIPYVIPAVDYVYSTEADGGFLELSLRSEFGFFSDRLVLEPYLLQGFDFGYATDEHDGANNFQVGVGGSIELINGIDLVGSVSHSWAQTDVERDGLEDETWGTIGFAAAF